jgi:hypothetical protein
MNRQESCPVAMQGASDHSRLVASEVLPALRDGKEARAGEGAQARQGHAEAVPNDTLDVAPERRKAGPLLFWSTCLLAAFLVFWVSGGHRLVLEPLADRIGNAPAHALRIEDVTSRIERQGDAAHLLVDGVVRNHGSHALAVPSIIIAVTQTAGPTTRYFLETSAAPLAPGAQYGFSSRLEAPANGVASVSITFQEGSR